MKIKIVEVSSGFANVPNSFMFADEYSRMSVSERPGSAYDKFYTIDLPDGFELAETIAGEKAIFCGDKLVELASVNHSKGHVTGVNADGFYHFRIIEES